MRGETEGIGQPKNKVMWGIISGNLRTKQQDELNLQKL